MQVSLCNAVVGTYRWTKDEGPKLLPDLGLTSAITSAVYLSNRHRSPVSRFSIPAACAVGTGFLLFPGWRDGLCEFANANVLKFAPPHFYTFVDSVSSGYSKMVHGIVDGWDRLDELYATAKAHSSIAISRIKDYYDGLWRRKQ